VFPGYIRITFEDVTMTDYFKHKVASMGKTVLETKLAANGVLSNSIDLTAWHVDYIHKVSMNNIFKHDIIIGPQT